MRNAEFTEAGRRQFTRDGFAVFDRIISTQQCDALAAKLTALYQAQQSTSRSRIGGVRNLLRYCPLVSGFAVSDSVSELLRQVLGANAVPVRSIFFDKTRDANWSVTWHQDLHIAVAEKIDTPGFGPWSVKAGVVHVQPPLEVLNGMVTVRLHLDDCDESNGALQVVPGSHAHGVLAGAEFERWRHRDSLVCPVRKGGVLLMRPLLLHASSPAISPAHRRVLHLEYATTELLNGLRWFEHA